MPNLETVLHNALEAHPRAKIVKVCVLVHVTRRDNPHIHIQVHTKAPNDVEAQSRPWQTVVVAQPNRRVTAESVLAWLRSRAQHVNGTAVPLHIHEDNEKPKGAASEFVELLWSTCHTLTACEAATLRVECPVCLLEMEAGDELVCLPCDGAHVGHWQCMQPWLMQAASCPCCRFEMPTSSDEQEQFDPLIQQTLKGVKQMISGATLTAKKTARGHDSAEQRRTSLEAAAKAGSTRALAQLAQLNGQSSQVARAASLPAIAAKANAVVAPPPQLTMVWRPPSARQSSTGETPSRMPPPPRPPPPSPPRPLPPATSASHGVLPSIRNILGGYARRRHGR
jgi:hypothetical protein